MCKSSGHKTDWFKGQGQISCTHEHTGSLGSLQTLSQCCIIYSYYSAFSPGSPTPMKKSQPPKLQTSALFFSFFLFLCSHLKAKPHQIKEAFLFILFLPSSLLSVRLFCFSFFREGTIQSLALLLYSNFSLYFNLSQDYLRDQIVNSLFKTLEVGRLSSHSIYLPFPIPVFWLILYSNLICFFCHSLLKSHLF